MFYVLFAFVCVAGWYMWTDAIDYAILPMPFRLVEGFYYHAMIGPMKAYWTHNLTPFPRFNVLLAIVGIAIAMGLPFLSVSIHKGRETKVRRGIRKTWSVLNVAIVVFILPAVFAVFWWAVLGIWRAVSFAIDWLFAVQ